MTFKLYTTSLSGNGRKPLALCYHLGLAPEIIETNVYMGEGQNPDYLAINPLGTIPCLCDGNFILWESNAIMQYICEKFANYRLYSMNLEERAHINRWLFWEASLWSPAISPIIGPAVGHRLLPDLFPKPIEKPNWNTQPFQKCISFLNSYLSDRDFVCKKEITIADFAIAGMMSYFRFVEFPFSDYPNVKNWYERIESIDAWKNTEAELWAVGSSFL